MLSQVSDEYHIAAVLEWTYSSGANLTIRQTLEWRLTSDGQAIERPGAHIHPR